MHVRLTREIKDTLWLMLAQGVNYLAPLLVWPYLMRVLGAEGFGEFSFGLAMAQYMMLLVDFGFNLTATKQIATAETEGERNRIFSATMGARLLLLGVSGVLMLGVGMIPRLHVYRKVMQIMWLMVVGNAFSMFWLFQGMGKIRFVSMVNAVTKIAILPLTFLLVKTEADVTMAAWIQVLAFIGGGVVTVAMTRLLGLARWQKTDWQQVVKALKGSWEVFLSNAATSIYTALFVVILAYYAEADEVGRYAAAEKIMRCAGYMLWVPLSQAYFPKVSQLARQDKEQARKMMRNLGWMVGVGMVIIGGVLAIGMEPVAEWLGKDYGGIQDIALVLAAVPLMVGTGGVIGQMGLIAMGGEKELKWFRNVYLIAGLVAIVSVVTAAQRWGAIGTAAALLLTETVVCAGMAAGWKKISKN